MPPPEAINPSHCAAACGGRSRATDTEHGGEAYRRPAAGRRRTFGRSSGLALSECARSIVFKPCAPWFESGGEHGSFFAEHGNGGHGSNGEGGRIGDASRHAAPFEVSDIDSYAGQ